VWREFSWRNTREKRLLGSAGYCLTVVRTLAPPALLFELRRACARISSYEALAKQDGGANDCPLGFLVPVLRTSKKEGGRNPDLTVGAIIFRPRSRAGQARFINPTWLMRSP
jgi:hypothetical protein